MTALDLLTALRGRGVTLTPWVDRLRVDAPQGALTPAFRAALRQPKAALLDLVEAFEERACIAAIDGRVPRAEAERLAWAWVLGAGAADVPAEEV